jgi:hypothetical protein
MKHLSIALVALLLAGCGHGGYVIDDPLKRFGMAKEAAEAKPPKRHPKPKTLCEGKDECSKVIAPQEKSVPEVPAEASPGAMHAAPKITPEDARRAQEHIDQLIEIFEKG